MPRKRKPEALRRLSGQPERNPGEPRFPVGIRSVPRWIDREAAREFQRLARLLGAAGVLCETDRGVLTNLSILHGKTLELEKLLQAEGGPIYETYNSKTGERMKRVHPAFPSLLAVLQESRYHYALLGLSPADRAKLHAPPDPEAPTHEAPAEDPEAVRRRNEETLRRLAESGLRVLDGARGPA